MRKKKKKEVQTQDQDSFKIFKRQKIVLWIRIEKNNTKT